VYVLDLQLSKSFLIGSRVAVSPVVDCFNVLNSHTVLARNGFVGTYDVAATSDRTFRVGVRISF
jgi:hypothetical protein